MYPALIILLSVLYWFWVLYANQSLSYSPREKPPKQDEICSPSRCGELSVRYPFRIKDDPACPSENHPGFELTCTNNTTTSLDLTTYQADFPFHGSFPVKAIDYANTVIQIIDPNLATNSSPCALPKYNLQPNPFIAYDYNQSFMSWLRCRTDMNSSEGNYIPFSCLGNTTTNFSRRQSPTYIALTITLDMVDMNSCDLIGATMATTYGIFSHFNSTSILYYRDQGFGVYWYSLCSFCDHPVGACPSLCYGSPYVYESVNWDLARLFVYITGGISGTVIASHVGLKVICIIWLIIFVIHGRRKIVASNQQSLVEDAQTCIIVVVR